MLPAGVGQTPALGEQQHLPLERLAHRDGGPAQQIAWFFQLDLVKTIVALTGEVFG